MAPTPEQFEEMGKTPKVGDVLSSPHIYIFKRGYPLNHKVLKVRKKKKDGKIKLLLTVKTTNILRKVLFSKHDIWYPEEVD
tara:strand:+ start:430 stop:672 length:243 start_codon:yes stop_codon:yes gene_type:complete